MPDQVERYWLNGKVLHPQQLALDRGLQYGDGVFRTLAVYQGEPVDLDGQLALLENDAAQLNIDFNTGRLAQECREIAQAAANAALKVCITRGNSQRGYAAPDDCSPNRWLYLSPPPSGISRYARDGVRLITNPIRLSHNPLLAGIKHLNRLEQVLARQCHSAAAHDEGLMCDIQKHVISGIQSNLFFCQAGEVHTPSLEKCGVSGRVRQRLLALARDEGMVLRTRDYSLQDIHNADEIFVCNSLIGVRPVIALDTRAYAIGPVTRRLQERLQHPVLS